MNIHFTLFLNLNYWISNLVMAGEKSKWKKVLKMTVKFYALYAYFFFQIFYYNTTSFLKKMNI